MSDQLPVSLGVSDEYIRTEENSAYMDWVAMLAIRQCVGAGFHGGGGFIPPCHEHLEEARRLTDWLAAGGSDEGEPALAR